MLHAHENPKVDNLLLELILALEFLQSESNMFATRAILPILVGRKLDSGCAFLPVSHRALRLS